MKEKGFTLVEAAVATGTVFVLLGAITPLVTKSLNDSRRARAMSDLKAIAAALAQQMRDTGTRPRAAGGPGGCTGAAAPYWYSRGRTPGQVGVAANPLGPAGFQTFENLLGAPPGAPANTLFEIPAGAGLSQRGPYMRPDMFQKTDPWGRAYVIIGYNGDGVVYHTPIWIVSAGESGRLHAQNLNNGVGRNTWNYAVNGGSTNLAIRLN
jgi:type II secretory pathway pseudopilin PulG